MPVIRITIVDSSSEGSRDDEPYVIAWPLDNEPATLTPGLAGAVRALVPGIAVVLVCIDERGDLRTFGDVAHSLRTVELGLDQRRWQLVDVDLPDDDPTGPVMRSPRLQRRGWASFA
ncbi:MAG TPA: hypothetical protein VEX36_02995 [Thermoleophilaceae bacterium]|nr:hypothetical protein [Thermoleophilaceae bacterium]